MDIIIEKIESITKSQKINISEDEVISGLTMLKKGGDFADETNLSICRKYY